MAMEKSIPRCCQIRLHYSTESMESITRGGERAPFPECPYSHRPYDLTGFVITLLHLNTEAVRPVSPLVYLVAKCQPSQVAEPILYVSLVGLGLRHFATMRAARNFLLPIIGSHGNHGKAREVWGNNVML